MRYIIRFQIYVFMLLLSVSQILTIQNAKAQIIDKTIPEKLKNADRSEFRYIPKKSGHYSAADWRSAIDSTWGQGMSNNDKLLLYDYCCDLIDNEYPSFFHIDDKWDSLYWNYRDSVIAGVSRGRFTAILNRMFSSLTDLHSACTDVVVSNDKLKPGVPVFVPTGMSSTYRSIYSRRGLSHFGASLAPLPDSTVFVYDVIPNHPLGLEPGDIILGYDNIPWKQLYKELIAAELPIAGGGTYGSNPSSVTHGLLTAAGENWHLFDVIDIVKYSTGNTVHLPTSLLVNQQMYLLTTDQLPVSGVPFPDIYNGHLVSYGIVDGTQTGYIYTYSWSRSVDMPPPSYNTGDEFLYAVETLINDFQIDGLIIDSRFNLGGYPSEYIKSLRILFNENQNTFFEFIRNDASNHYSMQQLTNIDFRINANNYLFDKPIAVLTGPYSVSCGDIMPRQMWEHPMVRTFGLGTNGAFGAIWFRDITQFSNDWSLATTYSNLTLSADPNVFLTHLNIPPDEEIWFNQEDAIYSEDTVVKRALEWIGHMSYTYNVESGPVFIQPLQDTLRITANVANPDNHNLNTAIIINTLDNVRVDSIILFDDGNHGDSLAGDGLFGAYLNPLVSEDVFSVSASTTDLDSAHYHILPRVTRFTTIGPVVVDTFITNTGSDVLQPGDSIMAALLLKNNGSIATAENITTTLSTNSDCVKRIISEGAIYDDINPGQTVTMVGAYTIVMKDSCPIINLIKFDVAIECNGYVFWTDSIIFDFETGIEKINKNSPLTFALKQNYPNPFNPITNIEFSIPKSESVTLKIYNILGQEVTILVSDKLTSGNYKYTWDASGFASGVYIYRLHAGDPSTSSPKGQAGQGFTQKKKMLLIR
ncbi:S41 family peptidase [Calditrichota bacterium]